jgi:two-component system sensor histidine kinase TtrS
MLKHLFTYILTSSCVFLLSSAAIAKSISIAVLAPYGETYTYKAWQPTIDYLQQHIPEHQFKLLAIEPSKVEQLKKMFADQEIDFGIVQPITFAELHLEHNATAILSIVGKSKSSTFGSVIFTRHDSNITSIDHIKDQTIAGATPKGLGGWLIGYNTINDHNEELINIKNVKFLGVQDNIVNSVLNGSTEVGIVRTGTLERMAHEGKIQLSNFNIINQQHAANFPYLLSTELYPEWALVKASHVSKSISKRISSTMLHISPGSREALSGDYWEWVPPLDYHPVHDLMRKLGIGKYEDHGHENLFLHAIKDNPISTTIALLLVLIVLVSSFWIVKLNNRLKKVNFLIAQQNEMILDSVSEGIYGVDLKGNCTFINQSLTNILGWSESDLIGKYQHEIMHHTHADGATHPSEECPVYATFQDGMQRFIGEDMFWKKNGEGIYVEYSTNPIKDKSGKTLGTVVAFRDITEQRKNENYMQELERSSRLNAMGEMVTEIAHELNQPLTTIATNSFAVANMMKSDGCCNDENNNKYLDVLNIISVQAEHAASIIRHLREVSKKDQGEYVDFDLNQSVQNSIVLLESVFKKHSIQLELELSNKLPKVKIQPVQIDQVIINLCKNAVESMVEVKKNKRTLHIESTFDDKNVTVSVIDTGNGINNESNLFDVFSTKKKEGMGIGLSISRSIIERHGGNLYLDKTSSSGSQFTFTIPIE